VIAMLGTPEGQAVLSDLDKIATGSRTANETGATAHAAVLKQLADMQSAAPGAAAQKSSKPASRPDEGP
jgi:hypothetical protein